MVCLKTKAGDVCLVAHRKWLNSALARVVWKASELPRTFSSLRPSRSHQTCLTAGRTEFVHPSLCFTFRSQSSGSALRTDFACLTGTLMHDELSGCLVSWSLAVSERGSFCAAPC